MPIINLKTSRALTESNKQTISSRLTEITSKLLRKNPRVTVINIDESTGSWFLNNEENGKAGAFQLSINITRGTNTQEEKENWLKSVWNYVHHTLSVEKDAVCYIIINEIDPDNWGYCGISQLQRSKNQL